MTNKEFAQGFLDYLIDLKPNTKIATWTFKGQTSYYYGSKGGGWANTIGFDFYDAKHGFILRSIPIQEYIVFESHNSRSQLYNASLGRALKSNGMTSEFMETYVIRSGNIKWYQVQETFKKIGVLSNIIASVNDSNPDWQRVLTDMLSWCIYRDEVKQHLKSNSKLTLNVIEMELIKKKRVILQKKKQIILQGAPGTGKTRLAKQIAQEMTENDENVALIQFHPAYSYEDFVRGIVAKVTENGTVLYEVQNKILAEMAKNALEEQKKANNEGREATPYILIIDEINRANLPAVLGELIYALEYRDEAVESLYALGEGEEARQIILPSNLYIIGTMNTADRSVGHIDYAIRRRFAFVDVLPDKEVVSDVAKSLFKTICELFIKNYDTYNAKDKKPTLERSEHLAPDFRPEDIVIGHSYFIVADENELKTRLQYEIKPLLKEYLKDGILLESARSIIEGL